MYFVLFSVITLFKYILTTLKLSFTILIKIDYAITLSVAFNAIAKSSLFLVPWTGLE
jgi:hypothetical protein